MKINDMVSMRVMLDHRKITRDKKCPVIIVLVIGYRLKRLYLGIYVHPDHFNSKSGKIKPGYPDAVKLNKQISVAQNDQRFTWTNLGSQMHHKGVEVTAKYLDGLTFKSGSHED